MKVKEVKAGGGGGGRGAKEREDDDEEGKEERLKSEWLKTWKFRPHNCNSFIFVIMKTV